MALGARDTGEANVQNMQNALNMVCTIYVHKTAMDKTRDTWHNRGVRFNCIVGL